jgi:hypothetical protein
MGAFAILDPDGSITAWGSSNYGGVNPPTGGGYTKIYSAGSAFNFLFLDYKARHLSPELLLKINSFY